MKMLKDAEENSIKDEEKKLLIEAKNKADSLIHSVSKTLRENSSIVSSLLKEESSVLVKSLQDAIKNSDINAINMKVEELTHFSSRLAQHIQEKKKNNTEDESKKDNKDEKVVDAKYEDMNKK